MDPRIRCAHCRRLFQPNPRVKDQRYCSEKPCQSNRLEPHMSTCFHQSCSLAHSLLEICVATNRVRYDASILASTARVDIYTLQKLLTYKHLGRTQWYGDLRDEAFRKASHIAGDIMAPAMNANAETVQITNIIPLG
jgi:hypothetical protein